MSDKALAALLVALWVGALASVVTCAASSCKPSTVRDAMSTLDDTCSVWAQARDAGGE